MNERFDASGQAGLQGLEGAPEAKRYEVVAEMASAGSILSFDILASAARDESYRVRELALAGLAKMPAPELFSRLDLLLRNNERADLRNVAIEVFPRCGAESARFMATLLKDPDEEIRLFAAQILGQMKDPDTVENLLKALDDTDENVRHASAESLGMIGDARAVGPLVDRLNDDFWVQYSVVSALGEIADASAVEPLLPLLGDDMLRQAATEALGKIGDPSALPALTELLCQGDPSARNDTLSALVKIHSKLQEARANGGETPGLLNGAKDRRALVGRLMEALRSEELEARKNAVIALGWLKEPCAVLEMVPLLAEYELEEYVAGALSSIGHAGLPAMIEALANPDPNVRASLLRCIGWLEDPSALQALVQQAATQSPLVRIQAALALAPWASDPVPQETLMAMIEDPDTDVRRAAIEVLGRAASKGIPAKVRPLLRFGVPEQKVAALGLISHLPKCGLGRIVKGLTADPSAEVRAAAFGTLAAWAPAKLQIDQIMGGLLDPEHIVRRSAAMCLGQVGLRNAEPLVTKLLQDPNPEIQLLALETLGRIGHPNSLPALSGAFRGGSKRHKIAALKAAGQIREKGTIEFLSMALKEPDPDTKCAALDSLGKLMDRKALPAIMLALDDTEWSVRSSAISALESIRDPRSVDRLIRMLKDGETVIKKQAISVLGQIGDSRAAPAIMPLVLDESIQGDALLALEKLGIPSTDSVSAMMERANTRTKCLLLAALGRAKCPYATALLCESLEKEFLTVRCQAAKSLAACRDKSAIPALLRAQKEDPSGEVRREATMALMRLNAIK